MIRLRGALGRTEGVPPPEAHTGAGGRWLTEDSATLAAMRLEYLEDPNASLPRVLLVYGDAPDDARRLRNAVVQLANGKTDRMEIGELPGFAGVDGCTLTAQLGTDNRGVAQTPGFDRTFDCILNQTGWDQVAGLLEPFTERSPSDRASFQYLSDEGQILWIISTDRSW